MSDPLLPRGVLHPRRRPAHHDPVAPHNRTTIVFVTVCTNDRRPVLANDNSHTAVVEAWQGATHWLVGRYMVMPDHIHFFCAPAMPLPTSLKSWVRFWKGFVTKRMGHPGGELWQTEFWDTQLRSGESYAAKWDYVRDNPVRAGLVTKADDWPYQGELNLLRWHA